MLKCEICGRPCVEPAGMRNSPILLVGEFPGYEEIKEGTPWCGKAGDVLHAELERIGIQFARCRATNLWLHEKPKGKVEIEAEFEWHYAQLMIEMKKAKAVLLMGSDLAGVFFNKKITLINGCIMKSDRLPKNIEVAVAAFNPALAFTGTLGDVRFGIEQFAKAAKKYI
jgi:uracil-DNA glycosylase family 4